MCLEPDRTCAMLYDARQADELCRAANFGVVLDNYPVMNDCDPRIIAI